MLSPEPAARPVAAHASRPLPALRAARLVRVDRIDVALFAAAAAVYLVVAGWLVFGYASVPVDTWARVGNAYYALFSRDPHLGAIGFVLSPVPTLAIMPILPFKVIAPALVTSAFAANIASAAFTGGTILLLRRILGCLGVHPVAGAALLVTFALHPMIAYYAANGLTEAPFVFSLACVCLALVRWLDAGRVRDLTWLGIALGFAYLTRYEALAAAMAAILAVPVVSYLRTPGDARARRDAAVGDALVAATPFVAAFAGWAAVSWLIVGTPFAHFSSVYGNSSQLEILRPYVESQTGQGTSAAAGYVARQVLGLAPVLPLALAAALARTALVRDVRVLAPLVAFGAPLAASVVLFLAGATVGFLRYHVAAVPLGVLLVACALARGRGRLPIVAGELVRLLPARLRPAVERLAGRLARGSAAGSASTAASASAATSASTAPSVPAGSSVPAAGPATPARPARAAPRRALATILAAAGTALLVAALVAAVPTSIATLRHPTLAREEADALRGAIGNDPANDDPSYVVVNGAQAGEVARYLDGLEGGRGSILIDVAIGNPVVLQSRHPERFVITTDRDFAITVDDPAGWGVRYLVVAAPSGEGSLDALNRRYPSLYATGAGIATELVTFDDVGGPGWRVFAVTQRVSGG